jgi:mRNA interferase MazF
MVIRQGSIMLVDFNPALGHEQKGKRPALVISNDDYFRFTNGLVIALPITSTSSHGYPLHVPLDAKTKTQGEIMVEQPKTIDTKARKIVHLEVLPKDILTKVLSIFSLMTK